jgi:hypothetical protein
MGRRGGEEVRFEIKRYRGTVVSTIERYFANSVNHLLKIVMIGIVD